MLAEITHNSQTRDVMFKNMKLGTKLLVAFLAVWVIPFAVMGILSGQPELMW